MEDHRQELDAWLDMWDEMGMDSHEPASIPADFDNVSDDSDDAEDLYYAYNMSVMTEDVNPNPVYKDTKGPDAFGPSKEWTKDDLLKEIESLKSKLYAKECQMAKMGGGNKWPEKAQEDVCGQEGMSPIEALRSQINKISDHLGIEKVEFNDRD